MKKNILISVFLLAVISLPAKEIIEIPNTKHPPTIDGKIVDGEWKEAYIRDEFYQISPGDNIEPSEKTEIGLMYDNENIYLMAKCYFDDLNRLRDNHCSRDAIYTTDRCYFFLDTFHNNERAYYLGCNANGEQADGIILDDIDTTIDLYYISKAQKTDYGFSLEIQLPLESIKYKSGDNVEWGFFFKRHVPDGPEEITSHKVQRGGGNFYDNYAILQFKYLPTNQNLKIIPAIVADYNKFEDKVNDLDDVDKNLEPELNVFYEPNSSLITRLTINPDFNIIEADGLEIEVNDRYPRYYQEKRPFFIEQTNPFRTDVNIFYTRQIVNPIVGGKLSGSFGKTSVFALAAVDEDVPGDRFFSDNSYEDKTENTIFGFASVCRKYGGNGFIRGAAALRSFDDMNNLVLSIDANKRFSRAVNADFQIAGSTNDNKDNLENKEILKGVAAAIDADYYNGIWFINNEFTAISEDFRADLGFVDDVDFVKYDNRLEYQIHAETDEDKIRYMEFASQQNIKFTFDMSDIKSYYWNLMNGSVFMNTFEYWTGFEVIMDNYFGKDYVTHFPWLKLEYEPFKQLRARITLVDGVNLYYNNDIQKGEYGDFYKYEGTILLRPNNILDFEFNCKYHETEEKYIARSYELKAKFQFHKNFWFRLIAQVINHDMLRMGENPKRVSIYPLFTYKPSSKTAIYVGSTGIEEKIKQISAREFLQNYKDTTYFFKVSYTFDIL